MRNNNCCQEFFWAGTKEPHDPWQEVDISTKTEYRDVREQLARQLIDVGRRTKYPRMTGDMKVFRETRLFVQERKRGGYKK